jgi:predicted Ser/Thr protein kinase
MAMKVLDDAAGKQVRCPTCKQAFLVAPTRAPAVAGVAAPSGPGVIRPPSSPSTPTPTECPMCKTPLAPSAISCPECGYLLQADTGADADESPNLCSRTGCGVANPAGVRYCQRCSQLLPHTAGTLIQGRYRIDKQLAEGGFGMVYQSTDVRENNRQVAIKEMICQDPQEFVTRLTFFRREAEVLKALQVLPTVPRFYELIEEGQTAYLALEFVPGTDLMKILEATNRPFTLDQVIEWAKSICDVLTHMHGMTPPVVHRDVKPDNVMLLNDHRSIKLIDFGTARDLGRSQKERMAAKTRVYTAGYAPGEQIIGKPEPRSDLFALAATLYHLVTAKEPNGHHTAQELEGQLNEGGANIPKDQSWFYELLKINLAEDANDRYFSAREIKADLERRRVTKEVGCPKCKAMNKVREPFCGKCGEPLTDPTPPCHYCGKANRMGSRFCIHCGNRLR